MDGRAKWIVSKILLGLIAIVIAVTLIGLVMLCMPEPLEEDSGVYLLPSSFSDWFTRLLMIAWWATYVLIPTWGLWFLYRWLNKKD